MTIIHVWEAIMPAGFDDREREAIKARLIGAAIDALGRGGLAAASVADLAVAASIAKGSFYAFYPSKEHLFMEAFESIEDGYRTRFIAAAAGGGSPRERLERAFCAAFGFVESEPALRFMDGRIVERLARALPPERVAAHMKGDGEAMGHLLEAWKNDGLLRDGIGAGELAAAGYAVFLVAIGAASLPDSMKIATRQLVARGLAMAMAAPSTNSDKAGESSI
jgi:AcrR family transcriptional regulator